MEVYALEMEYKSLNVLVAGKRKKEKSALMDLLNSMYLMLLKQETKRHELSGKFKNICQSNQKQHLKRHAIAAAGWWLSDNVAM